MQRPEPSSSICLTLCVWSSSTIPQGLKRPRLITFTTLFRTRGRTAAWYIKIFGATENARRNGGVPSALLTTPDKWISLDFSAGGAPRGGGGGGRGGRGGAPGGAPGTAAAPQHLRRLQHLQPLLRLQRLVPYPTRARSWTASRSK